MAGETEEKVEVNSEGGYRRVRNGERKRVTKITRAIFLFVERERESE